MHVCMHYKTVAITSTDTEILVITGSQPTSKPEEKLRN